MTPHMNNRWNAEMVADLRRLAATGMACSGIAIEINITHHVCITRNAVIGKLNRLGLCKPLVKAEPRRRKPPAEKRIELKPTIIMRRRYKPAGAARPHRMEDEMLLIPATPMDDSNIPLDQRKTLMELTNHTCRWPVGEVGSPEFFFCGGAADLLNKSPYCDRHTEMAFGANLSTAGYLFERNSHRSKINHKIHKAKVEASLDDAA